MFYVLRKPKENGGEIAGQKRRQNVAKFARTSLIISDFIQMNINQQVFITNIEHNIFFSNIRIVFCFAYISVN